MRTYNYYAVAGTMLHHVIENYMTVDDNTSDNKDRMSLENIIYNELSNTIDMLKAEPNNVASNLVIIQTILNGIDNISLWMFSVVKLFETQFNEFKIGKDIEYYNGGFEVEIYEPIKGLDINFKGFVDFIFLDKLTNTYYIWDFKVSKKFWDKKKKTDLVKISQTAYYKYFLTQKLLSQNAKDIKVETCYVNFELLNSSVIKYYKLDLSKEEYGYIMKTIKSVINAIKNDLFIASSRHCTICDRSDCKLRTIHNVIKYF